MLLGEEKIWNSAWMRIISEFIVQSFIKHHQEQNRWHTTFLFEEIVDFQKKTMTLLDVVTRKKTRKILLVIKIILTNNIEFNDSFLTIFLSQFLNK